MSSKKEVSIEASTYEDWQSPDVKVCVSNEIERAALAYVEKAYGLLPGDDDDSRRNGMWDFLAGARALLEEARKLKELTDIGGPDDVYVIEYVALADLESLFTPTPQRTTEEG